MEIFKFSFGVIFGIFDRNKIREKSVIHFLHYPEIFNDKSVQRDTTKRKMESSKKKKKKWKLKNIYYTPHYFSQRLVHLIFGNLDIFVYHWIIFGTYTKLFPIVSSPITW